jgi:hypothetical protein
VRRPLLSRRSLLRPSPRLLRLVLWSYAMKGLLLALVWLFAPELPGRAMAEARAAWTRVVTAAR